LQKTASQCCDRLLRDLGIDKKMSKEELIQFEGLVIEILPDAGYRVQLDAGYEVLAYTVGKMKKNRIKTLAGDRVTIALRSSEGPPDVPS
jgi:translation initiation factor IF-1